MAEVGRSVLDEFNSKKEYTTKLLSSKQRMGCQEHKEGKKNDHCLISDRVGNTTGCSKFSLRGRAFFFFLFWVSTEI